MIVRWPGHVPAGKVVDDPVINTDWLPTLLELIGQPIPHGVDGISFARCLTGRGTPPQRAFFWHFPHYTNQGSRPSGAMRDSRWMLVEYYDEEKHELYDLTADPGEKLDVAAQHPEHVEKMRAALEAWRKDLRVQRNRPNPDFDEVKARPLYVEIDASRFEPAKASEDQWRAMWSWREKMNAAVTGTKR